MFLVGCKVFSLKAGTLIWSCLSMFVIQKKVCIRPIWGALMVAVIFGFWQFSSSLMAPHELANQTAPIYSLMAFTLARKRQFIWTSRTNTVRPLKVSPDDKRMLCVLIGLKVKPFWRDADEQKAFPYRNSTLVFFQTYDYCSYHLLCQFICFFFC